MYVDSYILIDAGLNNKCIVYINMFKKYPRIPGKSIILTIFITGPFSRNFVLSRFATGRKSRNNYKSRGRMPESSLAARFI